VLPGANHDNTLSSKRSIIFLIALPVPLYFRRPKQRICFWHVTTPWTTVPETTIEKDGKPLIWEIDVWSTWKVYVSDPAANP
jgi:hypothetical protein